MSIDKKTLQAIIDAGRSAKPQHWGGVGENMLYLTPEMYSALSNAINHLPCPICSGVEGCDHTVPERERAAKELQTEPGAVSERAIHQIQWHNNKHWVDVPREEYLNKLHSDQSENIQFRIVHQTKLDRHEVVEDAATICMELSQKYGLEGIDALQSAAGILRTRLKRGSLKVALDFVKKLKEYEPEFLTEDPPAVEPEESGELPVGARITKRGYGNVFGFITKRDAGDSYEVRWYLTGRISTEARKNLVVAPYPISVIEQCEEHRGTDFEIYTFSDGLSRIMKRREFDIQFGNGLRADLERARANRVANENNRADEIYKSFADGAIAPETQGDLDKAVKVFEAAACKETYKLRDGVAAVLKHLQDPKEIGAPSHERPVLVELTEPVSIQKAMLAGEKVRIVTALGGKQHAAFLVNMQLTSWNCTKEFNDGYSQGFNRAATLMQEAMTEYAASQDDTPVEIWHGNRKVSIYKDRIIRVWGANIETEMNDEPRTLQSVQDAVDWVYGRQIRELVNRFLTWRLPENLRVDKCAYDGTYPQLRQGTNLLSSTEAEQMLHHVLNVPEKSEPDWIKNLRKELMLSKMTHKFTFSRDEVMELLGGPLAAIHVVRASAEDMLRDQLEEVGRAARQAEHARDVYRAVLEAMEFRSLDDLPAKGIYFAQGVGEEAMLRTVTMVKTLERIAALNKNPDRPYTSRLTEEANDNLDMRISDLARKHAQRSLNNMVWSVENHKLFILMREFLNEEIRRKEALDAQRLIGVEHNKE